MAMQLIFAFVISFILTAAACPLLIMQLHRLRYGQHVREDGPPRHESKTGTPTMGGLVFVCAAIISLFVMAKDAPVALTLAVVTLGCGLIGFVDDYSKIVKGVSLGLKARSKLLGEALIAVILIGLLISTGLYSSQVVIPFSNITLDLGIFYPLLVFMVILAASNSVNLTDGVDGLAAGTAAIAFSAYLYIAYLSGLPEAALFCAAIIGACLGFLIYNKHPARLFMGDTGSLGLGGALAAVAIITGTELFLIIIGGVFVLEALSVIAQVVSFRLTGKRVLLMSPLHHHFELKGWSEWRVVTAFWGAALIFAAIGVAEFARH